ncbi:hypothetical protein [Parapedobacter sp. 10938]|uniref:hypothetical protein n=1 Tax=Parapedobacter flavus TaxID=3110225 RepID=UPI002DBFFD0F|nr:hypothetical protein [Parapedobacter sp. 10938]MEC3878161.1 hypothetical protein [Parapedobacter sp. 10938]
MEKKTALGLTLAIISALTINGVMADTESGGGSGGKCKEPLSNTCYNIYNKDGQLISSKKGVLHIE